MFLKYFIACALLAQLSLTINPIITVDIPRDAETVFSSSIARHLSYYRTQIIQIDDYKDNKISISQIDSKIDVVLPSQVVTNFGQGYSYLSFSVKDFVSIAHFIAKSEFKGKEITCKGLALAPYATVDVNLNIQYKDQQSRNPYAELQVSY